MSRAADVPLRIAVDARTMFDEQRRGIGKSAVELYRALAGIRPHWRFFLFHAEAATDEPFAGLPNVEPMRVTIPGDRFDLWPRLRLPWAMRRVKADVFHSPSGVAPRWLPTPLIATIHDLIPWETKRTDSPALRWIADVRRSILRARNVMTDSEYTRGRIAEFCGRSFNVHVVPLAAISAPPRPPSTERRRELTSRFRLDAAKGLVLHFGMADPRKGTAILLKAWTGLSSELRAAFDLRIVGLSDTAKAEFEDRARSDDILGYKDFVGPQLFNYVAEDDARDLLAMSALLAYPTSLEGFGLPVLDGFAAGVPVLSGNRTSIPEVAGDAALLVDPTDVAALTEGLTRMLSSPELRAEYAARGTLRLNGFSWARTAERTAEVMAWNSSDPIRDAR